MASDTPRSSITVLEPDRPSTNFVDRDLEQEISRDENRFEAYGGDDPHEPEKGKDASPITSQEDLNIVTWDGPDDPTNPQNWSKLYKWFITVLCCVMTINVYVSSCYLVLVYADECRRTFASSAPTSASLYIAKEFEVSAEISYLITTLFLVGYVVGPVLWGPGSELYGRRPIFWFTMTSYTLFHLGQALAPNMETLLVTRFFGGVFAVAPLTNCGGMLLQVVLLSLCSDSEANTGVIADIWDAAGRGPATSLFVACVFLGPVLGPIVSGLYVSSI
jgi:hypothetical protein